MLLTYALDSNGVAVHIDTVPNGLQCNCHCRNCGSPLVAKNAGQHRMHHFAHISGHECEGAYESSLHLLAKEVLEESGLIMLPKTSDSSFPSGLVRISNLKVEEYDRQLRIKPDIEGTLDNGERILIEFYVTNKINEKKRAIILSNKLLCLEVDIQFQINKKKELQQFLLHSTECRNWILPQVQEKNHQEPSFASKPRDAKYEIVRDSIKEQFDKESLFIYPFLDDPFRNTVVLDLRQKGYDTCECNTEYNRFKCDLLLRRSQKEKDKQYPICINIRGRRLKQYHKPKDLKVIDVILNNHSFECDYNKLFDDGHIRNKRYATVYYSGFKETNEIKDLSIEQSKSLPPTEYTHEQVLQICENARRRWRK